MIVWRGYDDREAAAGFIGRHGVSIEATYVDADEDAVALLRGPGREAFDLVVTDNRYLPLLREAGAVRPIDVAQLSSLPDVFETFRRLGRGEDGTTWSVPYIWGRHPMVYNAAFVAHPPRTWLDVLSPEFRGKVAMLDGCVHQIIVWARVLGYRDPVTLTRDELRKAVELAIRVKRVSRARLVGWDELPAVLASGDAWVATAGWEAVPRFAAKLGADVRLVYPKEEAYPWLDSWCVVRGSERAEAAHAWIDWMIGPDAQHAVCRNLPCGTVNRRAVESLDADVQRLFPHDEIERLMRDFNVELPPREAVAPIAVLDDWHAAWEEVRAA
jgi:spermidine/putrescine transport system substrate-binding protein